MRAVGKDRGGRVVAAHGPGSKGRVTQRKRCRDGVECFRRTQSLVTGEAWEKTGG